MNREQAKELLSIIKAFSEGKVIQCKHKDTYEEWKDIGFSCFNINSSTYEYRIKPESMYRPFKNAEECWSEMKKHQPFGWVKRFGNYTQIITLDNSTVTFSNCIGKSSFLSYKDHKQIAFADGTPFGVKIKEG